MSYQRAEQEASKRAREARALAADPECTVERLKREIEKVKKDRSKVKKDDVSFGECYDPLGWYMHRIWTLEDAIELVEGRGDVDLVRPPEKYKPENSEVVQ